MTNQEYLIIALKNKIDDGGAAREAVIRYKIDCPYMLGDKRALCGGRRERMNRGTCVKCKEAWLNAQVDEQDESATNKNLISCDGLHLEQVEKVWKGELQEITHHLVYSGKCPNCGLYVGPWILNRPFIFCPYCGEAFTDEAVQIVMERLEALKDGK